MRKTIPSFFFFFLPWNKVKPVSMFFWKRKLMKDTLSLVT